MKDFLWGGATASYQCEGGWRNRETCDAYIHYAKVCFDAFSGRVIRIFRKPWYLPTT